VNGIEQMVETGAVMTRRCSPWTILATGNRPASRCDSLAKRAKSTVDTLTRMTTNARGNVALTRSALGKNQFVFMVAVIMANQSS
jgi:hypothetical protein